MIIIIIKLSVAIIYLCERSTMQGKILMLSFLAFLQYEAISAQRQWVPPTTTAAEMRNPYTWYWPYAIAASEAYRDYFVNAQQISNQLYQQAYVTQAFPWSSQQGNSNQGGQDYNRWGWRAPKQGGLNARYSKGGKYQMPSNEKNAEAAI